MKYDFDKIIDRSGTYCYKWGNQPDGRELPMWVADMDFQTAPEVMEAVIARAQHGIFGYTEVPDEWAQAYVSWWKMRHGADLDAEKLIFCTGVVPAISSIIRKLSTPAEKVLIQPPVYNIFYNCILNNGRQVLESPLKTVPCAGSGASAEKSGDLIYELSYEIDFDDLAVKLADPQCSLMILCNPQNPSGRIWTREELARVGELAAANGVIVISDEIHCDLSDPGTEYVPFITASEICRRVGVSCFAPSKAFNIAGLGSAAVYAQDPVIRHRVWRALNTDEIGEPGAFAVQAAIAAFTKGEDWLKELCAYIYENKKLAASFIRAELPEIKIVGGSATYLIWIDISAITENDAAFQKFLRKETGLWVAAGSGYGSAGKGFLRINLACPRSMVEDGLARLKKGVEAFRAEYCMIHHI